MRIIKISAIWCPGCLVMKKVWKEINDKHSNLDIIELDYDIDNDDVKTYNPGNILPVMIFLDNEGNELERIVGECSVDEIERVIDKYENN